MKNMVLSVMLTTTLGIATCLCLILPAAAFPVSAALLSPHREQGLFPKIRYPKVNIGKGAKNVGKGARAVVGGGKAVVNGGVAAVKGAKKGAEIYEAGRSLSSKTNGVPGLPHLK